MNVTIALNERVLVAVLFGLVLGVTSTAVSDELAQLQRMRWQHMCVSYAEREKTPADRVHLLVVAAQVDIRLLTFRLDNEAHHGST